MVDLALGAASGPQSEAARIAERFAGNPLFEPFRSLGYDGLEAWAWANYKTTILAFARQASLASGMPARLLEIGGGRDPLFSPEEARAAGLAVTVNDIDASELAMAPPAFARAHFDIAGDLAGAGVSPGAYDLVISKMVVEHVAGVPRAWTNMQALLAPNGLALAFVPTLYAPPFVINRLMPEALSARILRAFFPHRHHGIMPKFPARYEYCFGAVSKLEPVLKAAGFAQALVVPFWTHGYFRKIPMLRGLDRAVQLAARAHDWRLLSTYAYILARK
jgi:SAM-dependent methyltransferase